MREAVGPDGGGAAVTVTEACELAGVVPGAPVAVSAKVVVPAAFSVNVIPEEFRGLPSSGMEVPFWVNDTPVAFCVCQLTVTVPPCCRLVGLTVMAAVGFDGLEGFEPDPEPELVPEPEVVPEGC